MSCFGILTWYTMFTQANTALAIGCALKVYFSPTLRMITRTSWAYLTHNGSELHNRLQKLLCTSETIKHGLSLF